MKKKKGKRRVYERGGGQNNPLLPGFLGGLRGKTENGAKSTSPHTKRKVTLYDLYLGKKKGEEKKKPISLTLEGQNLSKKKKKKKLLQLLGVANADWKEEKKRESLYRKGTRRVVSH